jgi:hypothetical protein
MCEIIKDLNHSIFVFQISPKFSLPSKSNDVLFEQQRLLDSCQTNLDRQHWSNSFPKLFEMNLNFKINNDLHFICNPSFTLLFLLFSDNHLENGREIRADIVVANRDRIFAWLRKTLWSQ